MTLQEQPDSQAGDELDNLGDFLLRLYRMKLADAEVELRAYAERHATERAIDELKAYVVETHQNPSSAGSYIENRIATLTKEERA